MAIKLGLPGCDNPKADILQSLCNRRCDMMNGRWLMIVDSADEDPVFFSQHRARPAHKGLSLPSNSIGELPPENNE